MNGPEPHTTELPQTDEPAAHDRPAVPWLAPVAAFQFLTVCPPVVRRMFSNRELGAAVGWFPAVGFGLGGVLWGLGVLLGLIWPPTVVAACLLGVWVITTGALHVDGWLDFCDGIFGGRSREARLQILRDHRVGAYGVAGGVLLFLAKYAALVELVSSEVATGVGLVAAPVLGRWLMALAVWRYPYARDEGLGRTMRHHVRHRDAVMATGLASVATVVGGWRGGIAMVAAIAVGWSVARLSMWRIGGLTGDGYGAICELAETAVLLAWCAEAA